MFVKLSEGWFLNLNMVGEVLFSTRDGVRRARISGRQVDEFGEDRFIEWFISGDEALALEAALGEVHIRPPRRGEVVL